MLKALFILLLPLLVLSEDKIHLGTISSLTWQSSGANYVASWGTTDPGPQPILWYKLDENAQNYTIADSMGTASGNTAANYTEDLHTSGPNNTSALFFGGYDYISVYAPHPAEFDGTKPFSVTFWVKYRVTEENPFLVGVGAPNTHYVKGWGAHLYGGNIYFTINAGSYFQENEIQSRANGLGFDYTEDTWAFVCVAYDGTRSAYGIKFYINGDTQNSYYGNDSDTLTRSAKGDEYRALTIANNTHSTSPFSGALSDIRIFDFELNGLQAQDVFMGRPLSPTTTTAPEWIELFFDPFSTYPGDYQADGVYAEFYAESYNPAGMFSPFPMVYTTGPYQSEGWRYGYDLYYNGGPLPPDQAMLTASWYYVEPPPTVTIYFDVSTYPGDPSNVYLEYSSNNYAIGDTFESMPYVYDPTEYAYFSYWRDENWTSYDSMATVPSASTTLYAVWF
jgi:hypothetical protein